MYKSHIYRSSETPPRGSEYENTPLLSSKSCTNLEPVVLFGDSETSDLDPSLADRYFKYGCTDTASNSATIIMIPKRPPPLDNELFVSIAADPPCNLGHEKNYDTNNIDLVKRQYKSICDEIMVNEKPDVNNYMFGDLKTGSLQLQPDIVPVSHKDLKSKQSSLVTM